MPKREGSASTILFLLLLSSLPRAHGCRAGSQLYQWLHLARLIQFQLNLNCAADFLSRPSLCRAWQSSSPYHYARHIHQDAPNSSDAVVPHSAGLPYSGMIKQQMASLLASAALSFNLTSLSPVTTCPLGIDTFLVYLFREKLARPLIWNPINSTLVSSWLWLFQTRVSTW